MNKGALDKPVFLIIIPLIGFILPTLLPVFWIHIFALIFIKIILSVSLRQMLLTGMLNLACVAFMGIGAYFSGVLSTNYGLSFWFTMPLAGLFCAMLGLALGFPLFRMKGAYFFIGTVCFAIIVQTFFSNFYVETFGGVPGFTPIAKPHIKIPGLDLKFISQTSYYYLSFCIMLISLMIMYRLEHSRYGQYWKAIRDADRLIETLGVDLFQHKMLNFAICAFFSGICGSIYAPFIGIITPHDFSLDFVFFVIMYAVVGGSENFWGPIVGVLVLSVVGEFLRGLGQYELFCYGIILVSALLFMPQGFLGFYERVSNRIRFYGKKVSP